MRHNNNKEFCKRQKLVVPHFDEDAGANEVSSACKKYYSVRVRLKKGYRKLEKSREFEIKTGYLETYWL